jgi:hypothetical protein
VTRRHPYRENSRAVLIGVGTYKHSDRLPHIPAAAHNLTDLHAQLTAPGGVLDPENCWTVANPSSSSHIGEILEQAAERASDTLLVYYTGHGVLDTRGRLHLALTSTHPDRARWTALPFTTLREAILDSPATTRILILDCCFSGRALEALSDGPDAILGQADIAGTYVLASSARNETSYAPTGHRNTAFTAALLSAAAITPGLTLDDLYVHTQRHLRSHGHPLPQRSAFNAAGQLILFPVAPATPAVGTIEELEQALADRERVLGPDHPDTLETSHDLADAYLRADRLAEAIPLLERTYIDREEVLGLVHPDTLASRHDLAYAYLQTDRLAEAIPLLEKALADRERVLGPDHPDTLETSHDLAYAYDMEDRFSNPP